MAKLESKEKTIMKLNYNRNSIVLDLFALS